MRRHGYKGRITVVEVILMDREMEAAVRTTSSERELWKASRHQGIRRMAHDGVIKVLRGVTSFDELDRMVNLHDDTLFENA